MLPNPKETSAILAIVAGFSRPANESLKYLN